VLLMGGMGDIHVLFKKGSSLLLSQRSTIKAP